MALFADTENERAPRRRRVGWILVALGVVGLILLSTIPAPYVVEEPGPVFNTLGSVRTGATSTQLITIPGKKTYPTSGALDLLTVSISGNRQNPPSWLEIAGAWLDPSRAVVPIDEIYPQGETVKQSEQQSQADMVNSQQDAIAAALHELGYSFGTTLTVAAIGKGYPASSVLRKGDVIVSLNGQKFLDTRQLQRAVARNGTAKPATVVISRGGARKTIAITPRSSGGTSPVPLLGIAVAAKYRFPFNVKIELDNVGGPSAGMMFALGIIDKLTPGELNGGAKIAGTGTITPSGPVGPIGGIRQKMYGAKNAGARYFLAPVADCGEVVGHIPSGLRVFSVDTLDHARGAVGAISSGKGLNALPTCSAK